MRIYAASDLHGKKRHFAILQDGIRQSRADAVVLAGDILNYRRRSELLSLLEALPVPVFIVRGNSDPVSLEHYAAHSRNVQSLHLNRVTLGGVDLVGVGGTLPIPFHSRAGWHEAQSLRHLAPMVHSRAILVAHPPPWGCCDQVVGRFHAGSKGLSQLIRERSPAVMICGHIHEAAGVDCMGDTVVVNCAMGPNRYGAMVVLENDQAPEVIML